MNNITTMPNDKWWPFARQADYDTFNSNMKSDNRSWKDAAIRAWIEARNKQGSKHDTEG